MARMGDGSVWVPIRPRTGGVHILRRCDPGICADGFLLGEFFSHVAAFQTDSPASNAWIQAPVLACARVGVWA